MKKYNFLFEFSFFLFFNFFLIGVLKYDEGLLIPEVFVFAVIISLINFILQAGVKTIIFNLPALISCFFFVGYLVLRSYIDTDYSFELLSNSSSGPIFFLLLGVSLNLTARAALARYIPNFKISILNLIYPVAFIFFILISFFELSKESVFIIENGGGYYQRVGDYCFILVAMYNIYSLIWVRFNAIKYMLVLRLNLVFTFVCIIISVFVGSNKAPIAELGLLLIFLRVMKARSIDNSCRENIKQGNSSGVAGIYSYGAKVVLLLILIVVFDALTFGFLNGARIFNSGETGMLDSIFSRLTIFEGFVEQFSIAPVFGRMSFDFIYIHSVPFMVLTHLGVVGFVFYVINFALWFVYASAKNIFSVPVEINYYSIVMYVWVALVGLVSSGLFFSLWWFSIGLLSPMLSYQAKSKMI